MENVVWRFICQARLAGFEKAQRDILMLDAPDPRVPMMKIYEMFAGKVSPTNVMESAAEGMPDEDVLRVRQFYAHLYIALYHDARGDIAAMRKHIIEAEKRPIPHYMWDVAHVHADRVRADE